MSFYLLLCLIISTAYAILILYNLQHWITPQIIDISPNFIANKKYSVLIAARNEAQSIEACLRSILENNFDQSQLEIIVIDDHSDDKTVEIVQRFPQVKLLHLKDIIEADKTNSFKKAAINYGIQNASGDFILCTDADCIVPKNWINHFAFYHEVGAQDFIAAPVVFSINSHWISKFETLDIIGMMGLTNAGIQSHKWYLANGANLGFCKQTYQQHQSVLHNKSDHASGDDMVLVTAFAEWEQKIKFIKHNDATVFSGANNSLKGFIQQRLRWATKNKFTTSNMMRLVMTIPYLLAMTIIANLILAPFYLTTILIILCIQLFIKIGVDYIYLSILCNHFDHNKCLKQFPLSVMKHVSYIAFIGTASFFVKHYSWKERKVS